MRLLAELLGHGDRAGEAADDSHGGASRDATDTPHEQVVLCVFDERGGVALGDGVAVFLLALVGGAHAATYFVAVPLGRDARDDSAAIHKGEGEEHLAGGGYCEELLGVWRWGVGVKRLGFGVWGLG